MEIWGSGVLSCKHMRNLSEKNLWFPNEEPVFKLTQKVALMHNSVKNN
jgi:hypothetical protein